MAKKKTLDEIVRELSEKTLQLSCKIGAKMADDEDVDPADMNRFNVLKKHLAFSKKLQKEINISNGITDKKSGKEGKVISVEMVNKIKQLESSVGEIVRQMPR